MLKLLCAFVVGLLLGIHKNVFKSLVKGTPMPQAPKSHFWVKNRAQ